MAFVLLFVVFPLACLAVVMWVFHRKGAAVVGGFVLWLLVMAAAARAAGIAAAANPLVDAIQIQIVEYVVGAAVATFFTVASYIGGKFGIKLIEEKSRATLQEAAERFANSIIDQVQARYLGGVAPDMSDLIAQGVDYVKSGNPGTIRQIKITDDRIGAYVSAALRQVSGGGMPLAGGAQ